MGELCSVVNQEFARRSYAAVRRHHVQAIADEVQREFASDLRKVPRSLRCDDAGVARTRWMARHCADVVARVVGMDSQSQRGNWTDGDAPAYVNGAWLPARERMYVYNERQNVGYAFCMR